MGELSWLCGDRCTGCSACAAICPIDCVTMEQDHHGFYFPVKSDACIDCKVCDEVCPVLLQEAGELKPIFANSVFYGGYCKKDQIRKRSSSGGIFRILADWVLKRGGIVFGAALKEQKYPLVCTDTDHVSIVELQRSKYTESDMGTALSSMEENLQKGRYVLFCGTPCQVMGAREFLGHHEHLILCDFHCHGVPTEKAFALYLKQLEKKVNKKVTGVRFRSKKHGWASSSSMNVRFADGTVQVRAGSSDPYFRYYYSNVFNRHSCYDCNRPLYSMADFTLGDYWGRKKHNQLKDTNEGISLIAVHTEKGIKIFNSIKDKLVYKPIHKTLISYAYEERKDPIPEDRQGLLDDLVNEKFDFFKPSKKYGIGLVNDIKEPMMRFEKTKAVMDFLYTKIRGDKYAIRLTIEEVQELTTKLVGVIQEICDRNGLTMLMAYGSVLGAIRHEGPIPWDYNVALYVPNNELKRFVSIMEEQLPEEYYINYYTNNEKFDYLYPRIGMTGASTQLLHIDCFRLVGLPEDNRKRESYTFRLETLKWVHYIKAKLPSEKPLKKLVEYILKVMLLPIPLKWVIRLYEKQIATYPFESSQYVGCPSDLKDLREPLEKSVYGSGIKKKYGNLEVKVPSQYDVYLKKKYGNYLEFPPEKERRKCMEKLYEVK